MEGADADGSHAESVTQLTPHRCNSSHSNGPVPWYRRVPRAGRASANVGAPAYEEDETRCRIGPP
jgi:hypothetical protein